MNVAASPGASKGASAQVYPDSKPVEVPPRPTWTGADPRVAGGSTQMDPAEEELKENSGRVQNKRPHDLPVRGTTEESRADGRGDEEEQEEGPNRMETRAPQPPDH